VNWAVVVLAAAAAVVDVVRTGVDAVEEEGVVDDIGVAVGPAEPLKEVTA
jgi:hypothetical protein